MSTVTDNKVKGKAEKKMLKEGQRETEPERGGESEREEWPQSNNNEST